MAQYEFKLPDIGEGVTEGEIVNWLVKVGDTVAEDQEMVEVMTDKATVTIGAPKAGTVTELKGEVGDVIPVGDALIVFELAGGASADAPGPSEDSSDGPAATAVGDIKETLPGMGPGSRPASPPPAPKSGSFFTDKPLAAPATRKRARELDVDLRYVPPSGKGGRVTREDVEKFAHGDARGPKSPPSPAEASISANDAVTIRPAGGPAPAAPPIAALEPRAGDERVAIRGLRKRIYDNMARSKHTAAHFTFVDECDSTSLRQFRARAKKHAEAQGTKLTYLPFIVKAVVAALKKHPALNCTVDDVAGEMVLSGGYDIGIAAATESGLTVPVLRNADRLTILEMARELERLGESARSGKLRREDLGGSSFTITSLGKQGGLFATPIVNYPEVAILGVHEMKRKPVVRGDKIEIGHVMLLSLSFDHRIIDGHIGAAFAADIIAYLEEPESLMLEMG